MKIKKFLSGIVAGALAISTLAGVSSFSASADSEPETPLLPALNGLIKYQLRNSAEGTGKDIRFLAVVKQSDVEYGASAEWTISAATESDPDNFQEVEVQDLTTTAYRSVVANGVKVNANDVAKEIWNWSADTEYCFILSQPVGSFNDGDIVDGDIFVLNFVNGMNREVSFGSSVSSSKPDSSSEAEDSSSTAEQPSDDVIWEGSEDLGKWNKDVELGVAGIPTAKKDGILTIEYTGTGAAQIQVVNKLGEAWTWTPMETADGNEYFDTTGGKLQIVLTEKQASELAASKAMFLKGQNAVVTEITYTTPGKVEDSSSKVEDSSSTADSSSKVEDSSSTVEDSSSTSEQPSGVEVIWEGEEDLNNWKNDVELGVAGIPLAEENGILTIEYTGTGAAQISVINKLGEAWTWTPMETAEGNEYFDTTGGKLQIKLTATQAEQLAASKSIFLKGQNAVVTKMTYKGPNVVGPVVVETIWEGEEDLGKWNKDVDLGVAGIPLAEENGILTVEYTATGAAQISVINKIGSAWTWTPMETAEGNEYFDTTGGKLQIKLNATQAEQLATSKAMFLKGQNATVTKITYTAPGNSSGLTETIWTGEEDLNNWKSDFELGVAGIPLAEEGGILTIKYTGTGAAQIQVVNKLGDAWTWTPMETADGNEYFDTTGGKLQIKLNATQAEQLAASKAIFLKGTGAVVTEITYTSK